MKILLTALLILTPAAALAQTPLPVGSLNVAGPTTIAQVDTDKLKGEPSRMAWSPDASQIYLQTIEGLFQAPKAVRHYLIGVADGKLTETKGEPEWFPAYWAVKSHKSSPDAPGTEIALSSENKVEKTTSVPRGGDLARGGAGGETGTTSGEAIAAANNQQTITVHTMKLHGRAIGEFTNSVIVPGMTFAWAPAGAKAIAYAEPKGGKLVLMDPTGKRQELEGTKDAVFPMWSADGRQLAWLQKDGKKKYALKVARLGR